MVSNNAKSDETGRYHLVLGLDVSPSMLIEDSGKINTSFQYTGHLDSTPIFLQGPAVMGSLNWTEMDADGFTVGLQLRGADSVSNLSARGFAGPNGNEDNSYDAPGPIWSGWNSSAYLQYRIWLETSNENGSVVSVGFNYDTYPAVSFNGLTPNIVLVARRDPVA